MKKSRGRPPHPDILTPAEWRVANAVRHGLTNKAIAKTQGVNLDGVKYHVANIISKLNLKNRKALKSWQGYPINSLFALKENTVEQTLDTLGLGQISRNVKNIEKSQTWYRDILGLTHLYTFGNLAFFDIDGTRLMLSQSDDFQAVDSTLYLRVANMTQAYSKLQERGVDFINAPHMIHKHEDDTEEWMAFFKDLEGRTMALMSALKPQNI